MYDRRLCPSAREHTSPRPPRKEWTCPIQPWLWLASTPGALMRPYLHVGGARLAGLTPARNARRLLLFQNSKSRAALSCKMAPGQ